MFSFFNPFAFDLIEQVRVMVSSFNYYDPIHPTIKRSVIGLISGVSMDIFFRVLLMCALRIYINKVFKKFYGKIKLLTILIFFSIFHKNFLKMDN